MISIRPASAGGESRLHDAGTGIATEQFYLSEELTTLGYVCA